MTKVRIIVLAITLVIGLVALTFAVIGVATKPWVNVSGNTNQLKEKFGPLTNANDGFIRYNVAILVSNLSLTAPLATLIPSIVVGIVNRTLAQVEKQIAENLLSTTYSLFDKTVGNETTKVDEFQLPQGLTIAGLVCLFVGGILAVLTTATSLGNVRSLRLTPLFFFLAGSVLILLGYLLFTKIIVEDFGHELGIKSELGFSLILVVLSSIVGFITATIYGATKLFRHYRDGRIVHKKSSTTVGQVPLVDRRPASRKQPIENEPNDSYF